MTTASTSSAPSAPLSSLWAVVLLFAALGGRHVAGFSSGLFLPHRQVRSSGVGVALGAGRSRRAAAAAIASYYCALGVLGGFARGEEAAIAASGVACAAAGTGGVDVDVVEGGVGREPEGGGVDKAHEIMWHQHSRKRQAMQYRIIAAEAFEPLGRRLEKTYPDRFTFHPTTWGKFPDGTDNIDVGGFVPHNLISGEHVLFLASFHNNDVTLSQFQVIICLLQSFIESLTVVLPYYPVGTMERVTKEGTVATAATYAHMFSSLPSCGRPTRLMVYDLHTLQNRFYLHGNAVASLQTSIPILKERLQRSEVNCVAFPDDGAAKRFASLFRDMDMEIIVCGKTRGEGDARSVTIQDGDAEGKHIVIVDDLVQTGGTLYECGKVLKEAGAASVSAFVAHAVFPRSSWVRFASGGDRACFDKFWVTNSIPTVTDQLPVSESEEGGGIFEVLDLMEQIIDDLDHYSC